MKIYAHAGVAARHPSNTMSAFREALEIDCDGIELDIVCSSDGIPVTIHDETLEGSTNGSGLVVDHSAAQLAALDAGNGEGVPTLEEVFALVGDERHFDLEIKAKECERAVLDLLDRYPQTIAAISSFDWDVLAKVRSLAPDAELWVLTESIDEEAIAAAQTLGATTLAVEHPAISQGSMEQATAAGLQVMAWTVNSQQEANRLRDLGVFAICTDDPSTIR